MRRAFIVLAAVTPALVASCQSPLPSSLYPPDPLLVLKKPLAEARLPIAKAAPTAVAVAEPLPPPIPTSAVCSAKLQISEPEATAFRAPLPVSLIPEPEYGAATDFHWLIGTLEKTWDGHVELRFRRPGLDGPDGKVRLEDDPRLAALRDGEAVRVEGALVPTLVPPPSGSLPRYKATAITRICP
jgi:hypothetical protein